MDCNNIGGHITHNTSTDISANLILCNWHHWDGSVGGEPVGAVIAGGIVADIVDVAKHEWHSAETSKTRASPA